MNASTRLMLMATGLIFAIQANANEPKRIALLIGVEEYEKAGFTSLKYAEEDAISLEKHLTSCGFKVASIRSDATGTRRATKANIQSFLTNKFYPALEDLTKKDIVLLFFAGHGKQQSVRGGPEDAFFCPMDAHKSKPDTWISISEVTDKIAEHSSSENNLILIDACRNNTTRGIDGKGVSLLRDNMAILFACKFDQTAEESDELQHGVFSHFFIEGLSLAKDYDGEVTWEGLVSFVQKRVENFTHSKQRPNLFSNRSGAPPVFRPAKHRVGRVPIGGDAKPVPPPKLPPLDENTPLRYRIFPSQEWKMYNLKKEALVNVNEHFQIKGSEAWARFWSFSGSADPLPVIDWSTNTVVVDTVPSPRNIEVKVTSTGNGLMGIDRDFTEDNVEESASRVNAHVLVVDYEYVTKPKKIRFGVSVRVADDKSGLYILDVLPNSPATRGSMGDGKNYTLEKGDVIASINGRPIRTQDDFTRAVTTSPKIMSAAIVNVNDGKTNTLKFTLRN